MKRYFYLDDSLDDLELVERALLERGLPSPQVHVLSNDDAGATQHQLHQVHSLLRQDTIHSGEIGALIGLAVAAIALALAWFSGLTAQLGWAPMAFVALILFGFVTWEGGLLGFQMPNSQYRRFAKALADGQHMLIVDVEPAQERLLRGILAANAHLRPAGTGRAAPRWLVRSQQRWIEFLRWAP